MIVDRVRWLTGLRISTVAPGITAPVESATVPVIEEEAPPASAWAKTGESNRANANKPSIQDELRALA